MRFFAGYSFLLHDLSTQLWLFVRQYIESAAERGQAVAAFGKADARWTRGCVELKEGKAVQLVDRAPSTDEGGESWWKVRYAGATEEMPTIGKVPAECIQQQSAAEMLIFIFQMSFVQLGQDVALDQLSPSQVRTTHLHTYIPYTHTPLFVGRLWAPDDERSFAEAGSGQAHTKN